MSNEIWRLGCCEIAQAIREKRFSSREAVQAHLDRIDAVNGAVNAVTVPLAGNALRAADAADSALAQGVDPGPLHGVPFTVKENIDLAGSATTQGLVAMAESVPRGDAPHVAHLVRAGAIPIARTNTPDLGLRWHTDNALRGPTVNPWDSSRTPGGSSGGESTALATGMTPLGLGNDYGSSLRWPSQCCGTPAIRPTLGRVPQASMLIPMDPLLTAQLMAVQGPMARRVKDLRLALVLMIQGDPRDPWWTPVPFEGPPVARPIRVAVTTGDAHPDVAEGVRRAADALAAAGYAVEPVDPPSLDEGKRFWLELIMTEIRATIFELMKHLGSPDAVKFLEMLDEIVPKVDLDGYMRDLAERHGLASAWSRFAADHPLLLGPVSSEPPFEVGSDIAGRDSAQRIVDSMGLVVTVNLLGLPSVAVPVGVAGGLPQGVQIIGPRYREDLCLDAAEAVEAALGTLAPIDPR